MNANSPAPDKRRIRRNALLLALLAVAFYVVAIVINVKLQ